MRQDRVVVIGAGIGGLTAGLTLAARGLDVTLLEAQATPGGKMRQIAVGAPDRPALVDAGPTVFTMRWVFDELFDSLGLTLSDHLTLTRAETLARHAWGDGSRLDLFADVERSRAAVEAFAGAGEAAGFEQFCAATRKVYQLLEQPFLRSETPSAIGLVRSCGLVDLARLARIGAFSTLWGGIGQYFRDPRLQQLFGRYATYCGSSPFEAPATLMLIAHVEQDGVWLVDGGMHAVARAFADLAAAKGARIRYGARVDEILVRHGRVSGVLLAGGEVIEADTVISNADAGALSAGLFGRAIGAAGPRLATRDRSFSAVTFACQASTSGFPLARHNVFFSSDYAREFADLRVEQTLPREPTIYVCAQDRGDSACASGGITGPERLLCLINAPPTGDDRSSDSWETDQCAMRVFDRLRHFGLHVDHRAGHMVTTTPTDFHRLFPATGGALYGRASHGWMASFQRASSRTRVPGLYLAGGSTHPGPGVPMATLSGRNAAARVLQDLTRGQPRRQASSISASPSRPADMAGGTSTA